MMKKYPKGSEWRKWDYHVHTPASWHYKNRGTDTFQKVADAINSSDVQAFGVNDYLTIDGYLTLRKLVTKVIFPVVEFRMTEMLVEKNQGGPNLNFHLLFSNEEKYLPEIQAFLTALQFDDYQGTKRNLTSAEIVEFGKQVLPDETDSEKLRFAALEKIKLPFSHVLEVLEDKGLRDQCLIILPYDEYGGIDGIDPKADGLQKSGLIRRADMIGSSSSKVRQYLLGQSDRYTKEEFALWVGKPKPIIKGSDAHKPEGIGHLPKKADGIELHCWVKADLTFEGLKQAIYEPEARIFIGPQKPEEKKPYFTIDKVRFLDNTSDVKFGSDPIEINQNLTTIIGGKSTGKSLLLYYMAKTINRVEVQSRISATGLPLKYDFDALPDFNFEVIWKDGQKTLLRTAEGASAEDSKQRKILYIPQKYLNTLSEEKIESREALNEFILGVILQDVEIRGKYEESIREIKAIAKTIPTNIAELFSDKEEIGKTEEELKQAGDEKGIESYIKSLQTQVDAIKAKSGLVDEQLKLYESLVAREKDINTQISNLGEDRKTIRNVQTAAVSRVEELRSTIDEYEGYLNDLDVRAKFKFELKVLDSFAPGLKTATSNILVAIEAKEKKSSAELATIKADLAPLLAKVKLQSELQEKSVAIQKEQQKLNEIAIKKNALKTKRSSFEKKAEAVVGAYKLIAAKYDNLRNEFKTFESKFGDISLSVLVGFDEDAFTARVVREYLNRRDLKKSVTEAEWGEEAIYQYDPLKHLAIVSTIFDGLLAGGISTLKARPVKDAVEKLLGNYFFLDFRIFYKNDSLDKMSPGKKGLVLLRLLINLSNEEWPILLDQPEDDLDNRSVYDDLVEFLKKKKIQRQIIIVTHNPNLVVSADAEEVIVANQSGQEVGRDNRKHRFEYISGALEDSFESKEEESAILYRKGVRQHVCEILEGGKIAFQKREQKYGFPK